MFHDYLPNFSIELMGYSSTCLKKMDRGRPTALVRRALLLERGHLLPQSEVLNHEVGSAPKDRPKRRGAERDDEEKNVEHGSSLVYLLLGYGGQAVVQIHSPPQ
jgi:hypothetical protein